LPVADEIPFKAAIHAGNRVPNITSRAFAATAHRQ
jgi:hypothetical protein